ARLRLAELSLTLGEAEQSAAAFREILDLGGPPELLRAAGRRALDLAEASDTTGELFSLAVERTVRRPEADEPRQFLLDALDRIEPAQVERWLRHDRDRGERSAPRVEQLRRPLVVALSRGSIGTRLRAAEHLGQLSLPETALPLAKLGATLRAPRDSTATVRNAFERARMTAIDAAGHLRDPAAIPQFRDVLLDSSQTQGTRHAAAWALASIGGPPAAQVLSRYVETGFDPMLTSLGCLVLSRLPRDQVDDTIAYALGTAARDNGNPTVRHACAFAQAALTPDKRLDRLHATLQATDPMQAAIAAWRLGRAPRPRSTDVQALLGRVLGPAGLARNAAIASLNTLLRDRDEGRAPNTVAALPAPTHDHVWSMAIERWLEAQVAPPTPPLPAQALVPWAADIDAALETARAGTRAERDAATQTRCPSTRGSTSVRQVCLVPLTDGPVALPPRN
ncbi:MAG: HEAT repeat domain-containing protein, partial [Acidobacteriota bacterium]